MTVCSRCQRGLPPDARFCPGCGHRLGAAETLDVAARRAAAPPHVAERILVSGEAIAAERKQVTVLFADLKGSMEILADRDPEEAGDILDAVLERMIEAVHRYDGTVSQVMGDGIMALFGAPLAQEDHAVRGCYAALLMQESIGAYGDTVQRERGLPVQIRVGLNSGEVLARSIGDELNMGYTALGQTVHLAARMEQMAKPGSVLATSGTMALAGRHVEARALGPIPVKGLGAAVDVFEVLRPATARARLAARGARGLTAFIGRETEMGELRAALAAARAGRAQVVALIGEAGVGKSRLVGEFSRECRAQGCLVLETAGLPYGRPLGHRPGADVQLRYFGIEPEDDPAVIGDKVRRRLHSVDPALEQDTAPMLWLFGALPAGHPFYAHDPGVKRRRLAELQSAILEREGRRNAVLLVVEDVQWLDSETQTALEGMVLDLPPGLLMVLTHRPEHEGLRTLPPAHRRLHIDPLPPPEAERLLDGLVGSDAAIASVKRLLVERTEGNPLFLEECVRSLVETGGLVGAPGVYRLGRPVSAIDVPSTVRAVLEARIDRLSAAEKRLLQAAAVVGEEVATTLVEAIADLPPETVRAGLGGLRASGLLREVALFPEVEYAFGHSLTHDVAYEGLRHDQRRALHGRLADALERLEEGDSRRSAERLAHHALRGERWDAAVRYCRQAGHAALGRAAYREARALIEAALDALGHLRAGAEAEALGVDLRLDLSAALVPTADHARSLVVLGEAEALAATLGDERRLARALSLRSANLWHLGESDEAVATGRRALALAERLGDLDLQVMSHYSMGGALRTLGDHREAVRFLGRNLTLLAGPRAFQTFGLAGLASVLTRGQLGWSLAELGDFEEALSVAEEAIRVAEEARHPYTLAHAHLGLGGVLLRRGGIGEAMAVLERGLAACEEAPALFPPMAGDLAVIYALSGRMGRALELGEQAVARAQATARIGRLALIATHVGEANLLAGRLDEAESWARRALALARSHKERGNQVYALRLLGLVAAERHPVDPDTARACFEEAIALAAELGVRPLLARCHLALGRLARRLGDAGAAARHLAIATELFRAMGMTFWLERLQLDRVGP